ncbi:5803_t:CDS:2, partial [Entrophospora sp. SA101]
MSNGQFMFEYGDQCEDILNQTIFNGKSFLDAGIDVDVDKSFANNVNPADDNRDL